MAINWTEIEGYREDMTADEKLALLENREETPPKPDLTGYVPKSQFDKVSSELATAKKNLRSRMTEDEQREAERQAQQTAMETELKTLRHEKTVSTYKANYLGMGFDEALASETAEAMADGDMERVFANMKKHGDSLKKTLTAEIMKDVPAPPAGDDPGADAKKKKELNALRVSMGLPEIK